MAVPARNVSKTRQKTRRAHMALEAKATTTCPNCGAVIKAHRVCKECGYYKNAQVIKDENTKEVETKKEKKTKKEEKQEK